MTVKFKNAGVAFALVAGLVVTDSGMARAGAFPDKPITIMVGFRAGGGTDTVARLVAKSMQKTLGQSVVVMNKGGGGGAVMAAQLKAAKPDGYTIGMAVTATWAFNPVYSKKTRYTLEDFTFLGTFNRGQGAFVSLANRPWKDWKGLVAYARSNKSIAMSSQSPLNRLASRIISRKEGIRIKAIPVKGGKGMVQAVLGGHVDFGFSGGVHKDYVDAGKMIVLASTGAERLESAPDAPTLLELGYGVVISSYSMAAAPAGLAPDVERILAAAIKKAANDKDVVDLIVNRLKRPHEYLDPKRHTAMMREMRDRYRELVAGGK